MPDKVKNSISCISYRYINNLPTIVSTERSPQELVSLDEATGSRIIEMAGDHVYAIAPDLKKNFRLRRIVEVYNCAYRMNSAEG